MCRCVRVSPEGFCKCARLQEDVAKVGGVRVCVCVVGVAENGGVRMPMGVYGEGKGVALGRGAVEWGQALIQKKGKTGRMGNERLPEARNEAPYSRKVRAPTRVRCKPVQTCRAKEIGACRLLTRTSISKRMIVAHHRGLPSSSHAASPPISRIRSTHAINAAVPSSGPFACPTITRWTLPLPTGLPVGMPKSVRGLFMLILPG